APGRPRRLFRGGAGPGPGPALREPEQALLAHDPALSAPPRAGTVEPGRRIVTVVSAGFGEHGGRAPVLVDPGALNASYHPPAGGMSAAAGRPGGAAAPSAGGGGAAGLGAAGGLAGDA